MKNTKSILAVLTISVFLSIVCISFNSCSKDSSSTPSYECTTCASTPDALAENDGSAKGVYKGIVVGSSGSLYIDIQNGTDLITGTLIIDGVSVALTSSVSYVSGQPYVAPFTGIYNGSPISITFSVGLSGGTPTVTSSDIPGHPNTVFTLYKETSTSLIEVFEGGYTKPGKTGTFNILLSRGLNLWGGIAKGNEAGAEVDEIDGTIDSSNRLIESSNGTILGTLSGDEINGSFQDGNGDTVTIHGERTL